MLEQKRRQFWNRQRIPNKNIIFDFRFSLSVFCYFRLNNINVVFFPYNFYIPIENVMWIENGDEIQKSEMILLLGILWRFQNCFCFCSSVRPIRYWVPYFWKWVKKKKTKPKFEKSSVTKCFLFLILRMYTKFHKNRSINKKADSETRWSL